MVRRLRLRPIRLLDAHQILPAARNKLRRASLR
jgi:hypothetical protein